MPFARSFSRSLLLTTCLLVLGITSVDGLATPAPRSIANRNDDSSRRAFLSTSSAATAVAFLTMRPRIADARYVLNDDTGEYDQVAEENWKTAWGERLDKARSMSTEEVFLAAQGAGNLESKAKGEGGEESEASRKRRALAGCRNDRFREKGGAGDVRECVTRVMDGDYQFMIDAM